MIKKIVLILTLSIVFSACKKTEELTPAPTPVVTPPVSAAFTSKVQPNGVVEFTNNSVSAESYEWDFGDNIGKSTEKSPKYTYKYNGTYKVKLKALGKTTNSEVSQDVVVNTTINEPVPITPEEAINMVLALTDKGFTAFDTLGNVKWTYSTKNMIMPTQPKVQGANIYVSIFDDNQKAIHILNKADGKLIKTLPFEVDTDFEIENDILIVAGIKKLFAYDLKTNKILWERESTKWKGYNVYYSSLITISNGKLYLVEDDRLVICLDVATSKKYWEYYLGENDTFQIEDQKILVKDSKVFVPTQNKILTFNEQNGNKIWEYTNTNERSFQLSYQNDTLFTNASTKIIAFKATTGAKVWEINEGFTYFSFPFLYNNRIYFGNVPLLALYSSNGKVFWSSSAASNTKNLVVSKNTIYSANSSEISAINSNTGKLKWRKTNSKSIYEISPTLITQSGKAIYPY